MTATMTAQGRKMKPSIVVLAVAAAAAIIASSGTTASAAARRPVVHHARCTETAPAGDVVFCNPEFNAGDRPGDVHIVVRTSVRQRVTIGWTIECPYRADTNIYGGSVRARTTVRRHLLGRVRSTGDCSGGADVSGTAGGSVTVVFSWIER
jgi:hypothetical protein